MARGARGVVRPSEGPADPQGGEPACGPLAYLYLWRTLDRCAKQNNQPQPSHNPSPARNPPCASLPDPTVPLAVSLPTPTIHTVRHRCIRALSGLGPGGPLHPGLAGDQRHGRLPPPRGALGSSRVTGQSSTTRVVRGQAPSAKDRVESRPVRAFPNVSRGPGWGSGYKCSTFPRLTLSWPSPRSLASRANSATPP